MLDNINHVKRVCRQTSCFVNTKTEKKLQTLKVHFKDNGIITRVHWNTKRLPKNTTCTTEIETVKSFVGNYAMVNVLNLLGRVPGCKSDIVSPFPMGYNKQYVHQQYCGGCEAANQFKVSYWVSWIIGVIFFLMFLPHSLGQTWMPKNISVFKSQNKDEKIKSDAIQKKRRTFKRFYKALQWLSNSL